MTETLAEAIVFSIRFCVTALICCTGCSGGYFVVNITFSRFLSFFKQRWRKNYHETRTRKVLVGNRACAWVHFPLTWNPFTQSSMAIFFIFMRYWRHSRMEHVENLWIHFFIRECRAINIFFSRIQDISWSLYGAPYKEEKCNVVTNFITPPIFSPLWDPSLYFFAYISAFYCFASLVWLMSALVRLILPFTK